MISSASSSSPNLCLARWAAYDIMTFSSSRASRRRRNDASILSSRYSSDCSESSMAFSHRLKEQVKSIATTINCTGHEHKCNACKEVHLFRSRAAHLTALARMHKASGRGNGDVSTRVWGRDGPRVGRRRASASAHSSMNGWAKMVLQVRSGRIGTTVARRTEPSHGRRSCLRIHPETCEASWPGRRGATSTVTVTRMRPSRAASILINRSSVNRPT